MQCHLINCRLGVVASVKVTVQSHGYNGYLGLGAGHPQLLHLTMTLPTAKDEKQKKLEEKMDRPDPNQTDLLKFLTREAESGSKMTPQDILAVWLKNNNPAAVTVKDQGSVSSVTAASASDSDDITLTNTRVCENGFHQSPHQGFYRIEQGGSQCLHGIDPAGRKEDK